MSEMSTSKSMTFIIVALLFGGFILVGIFHYLSEGNRNIESIVLILVLIAFTYIFSIMSARLHYLKSMYYEQRFHTEILSGGNLKVQYLKNKPMNVFEVFVFLFKPLRYMEVGEFILKNNKNIELEGNLKVVDNRLLINDYYLKRNSDLYKYIGEEIKLIITGDYQELIEKNLKNYVVEKVEVV